MLHLIDNSILFAEQPATCVILDKELCSTLAKTVEEGSKVNEEPLDCDSGIISSTSNH